MREVALAQLSRSMLLHKIDFLCRSFGRSPVLHFALQGPQLAVRKTFRMLSLQRRENRLHFQSRVRAQLLSDLRPNIFEPILPCPPMAFAFHLTRQPSRSQILPRRLHVQPAFDAAISCVFSVFDNLNNLLICWSVTIP